MELRTRARIEGTGGMIQRAGNTGGGIRWEVFDTQLYKESTSGYQIMVRHGRTIAFWMKA
eukprot:9494763-Pyramimonas_sp.AAC.2